MLEDLAFAFRMFRRSKTRTALSLLGVIIGTASVIVIAAIGGSAEKKVKQTFGAANLSMIEAGAGAMRRARENAVALDAHFREEIFSRVPHIRRIWYKNSLSATLYRDDLSVSASLSAVEYGYLERCGLTLGQGRFFSVSDGEEGAQVIILGSDTAEALFPDGVPEGARLTAEAGGASFGFRVIGVLTGKAAGFESPESGVYIPRGFYLRKVDPRADASSAAVEALSPARVKGVTAALRAWALEKAGDEYALRVNSMQALLEEFDEVTGTISLLLSGIAAISLLVGGIGIMNIMIVTVTERKREIGIRKALGAPPAAIRAQFLTESAAITVTGGVLGAAAGIGAGAAAQAALSWPFAVPWAACGAAFLFSAFVGVFFGFYPAALAARLDPAAALSAE